MFFKDVSLERFFTGALPYPQRSETSERPEASDRSSQKGCMDLLVCPWGSGPRRERSGGMHLHSSPVHVLQPESHLLVGLRNSVSISPRSFSVCLVSTIKDISTTWEKLKASGVLLSLRFKGSKPISQRINTELFQCFKNIDKQCISNSILVQSR